jgi:hypothetical protein
MVWFNDDWKIRNGRKAKLYGKGGCWLGNPNRPVVTTTAPKKIFYDLLNQNKKFKRLKGNTSWHYSLNREGQYYKRYLRSRTRNEDSFWWLYCGKKNRRGLIEIPDYSALTCRVHQRILYVPKEDGGKGIGKEIMQELMAIVDTVDGMCKAGTKHKNKTPSCQSFILALYPNSFVINDDENGNCYWNLEEIENEEDVIDWTAWEEHTHDEKPDRYLVDETEKYLPEDKCRMNMKQLQEFYGGLGFVDCPELAFNEWYDWNSGRQRRELGISARSFTHKRWAMIYPAVNLERYEKEKEEG